MKNLSLGLTNADLVEVDEFLVNEYNEGDNDDAFSLSKVEKDILLEYSETWTRANLDKDMFHKGNFNNYYQINLPVSFRNRRFEVFFRLKNNNGKDDKRKAQFFLDTYADAHASMYVKIPIVFRKKVKFSDIIDIWYRLLIPPTQQYSTIK